MAEAVLRELLPGGGAAVDATVVTYMADMLADRTLTLEDLQGSLGPLLADTGAVAEGTTRCTRPTHTKEHT
jgi:hypothetical protein